jgi:hypothetical protein
LADWAALAVFTIAAELSPSLIPYTSLTCLFVQVSEPKAHLGHTFRMHRTEQSEDFREFKSVSLLQLTSTIMANLFAQTATKDSLVEFRAGRLWKDANGSTVRADKRKGLVIVKKTSDDQLIHFMWKDRATGNVDLDLIVFPEDAVWRRLKECTTGRVYLLEFKTGSKNFFWMQEPNASKDDEYADALTEAINGRMASSNNTGLQSLLGQLGGGASSAYNQLAQGSRPTSSSGSSSSASNTSSSAGNTASSTQTSSGNSGNASQGQSSSAAPSALSARLADVMSRLPAGASSSAPQPRLTDVLNTQDVLATGALQDEAVLAELQKHLPESERNSVIATLRSPQFRQMVDHLNSVLKQSPQALSTLLSNFGLQTPSEPAANRLETFLKAIMEAAKKDTPQEDNKDSKMDES